MASGPPVSARLRSPAAAARRPAGTPRHPPHHVKAPRQQGRARGPAVRRRATPGAPPKARSAPRGWTISLASLFLGVLMLADAAVAAGATVATALGLIP